MNETYSHTRNSGSCLQCSEISCAAQCLSAGELEKLSGSCSESFFSEGEVLIAEGSFCSQVVYLKSGLVKEYLKEGKQHEYILQVVKPHSYLGLPSLFGDKVNNYSYRCLTDVRVCFIRLDFFINLLKCNCEFAYEILSAISRDSLNNYHRFITQHQKAIYGKMADGLLYFSKVIFESQKFRLPLSRFEMACLIGASRESVSRQLHSFEQENIIRLDGQSVEILQMKRLEQISRYG